MLSKRKLSLGIAESSILRESKVSDKRGGRLYKCEFNQFMWKEHAGKSRIVGEKHDLALLTNKVIGLEAWYKNCGSLFEEMQKRFFCKDGP